MASLGSGRKEHFYSIESLRKSEAILLKTLLEWNYDANKASSYLISSVAQMSVTAVDKGLRYLNGRGIVRKSPNGSWHLNPMIEKELKINHTSTSEASEQAQSTPGQNTQDPSDPV